MLLVIALLLILAGIAAARAGIREGRQDELINKVYIYLVLFATLMMTVGGSVALFSAVADIIVPAPYYQPFEDFKMGRQQPYIDKEDNETAKLSEEELRIKYEVLLQEQREIQVARGWSSLVKSLGWIVIPLPIFLIFQRRLAGEGTP